MTRKCFRPGCQTQIETIGVCVSCANSNWKPQYDGIQFRDSRGRWITTDGWKSP